MDTFRWFSIAVSMILGLGVTRLLSAAVAQFQARKRIEVDAVPLLWAAALFLQQIGFWWSLGPLAHSETRWTFAGFLLLITLALALFLAGALLLPQSERDLQRSQRSVFEGDGRWALLMLAAFNGLAIYFNWINWSEAPLSTSGLENAALTVLPLLAFPNRRWLRWGATVVYVILIAYGFGALAQTSY